MIIVKELSQIPPVHSPRGLTIGMFDGVHLGHQYLLKHLRSRVTESGTLAVLTFVNHPSSTLQNHPQPSPLCSPEEKIERLRKQGVDLLILFPFTQELAQLSYDRFLTQLHQAYPFTHLVLGKGASFGKGKQGDEPHVQALGKVLGFDAEYLDKFRLNGEVVSSTKVRTYLAEGNISAAHQLLGDA